MIRFFDKIWQGTKRLGADGLGENLIGVRAGGFRCLYFDVPVEGPIMRISAHATYEYNLWVAEIYTGRSFR